MALPVFFGMFVAPVLYCGYMEAKLYVLPLEATEGAGQHPSPSSPSQA